MNMPNWISVTLKSWQPVSQSYMGSLMQNRKEAQACVFLSTPAQAPLTMRCYREGRGHYGFAITDGEQGKEQVMAFCSMLLQCPEVESVLLTCRDHVQSKELLHRAEEFRHSVQRRLPPQRLWRRWRVHLNG